MKSAYDLLMISPDEQIVRLRLAWKATADGDWVEAESKLRNAARESDGQFSADCLSLADHCKAQAADSTL